MDQIKIGSFIKELRKEQNLTQEELAEKFNVARRTVSRWETGSNIPDLDILIEMADFYDVNLREILDGERKSEKMNEELKETVLKVAEYSNEEKKRDTRRVLGYFVLGIVALIMVEGCALSPLHSCSFVGWQNHFPATTGERERILLRSWKSYKVFPVYSKPPMTCLNPPCTALVTFTFSQVNTSPSSDPTKSL